MKRGRVIWGILIVIGIGILLGYALLWFTPQSTKNKAPFSAENARPEGLKALYRFYQVRGYQVKLWKQNYQQLPNSTGDLLMIVGPQVEAPNQQTYQVLMDWVRKGNTVVLWSPVESDWTNRFGFGGISCPESNKRQVLSLEKSVWFQRTKRINWPSGQCVSPKLTHEDVLIDSQYHSLMVKRRVGQGEVYYTPETEILINNQIHREDHMQLLLGLAEGVSGTIWFDESVHPWPPRLQPNVHNPESNLSEEEFQPPPTIFEFLNLDGWMVLLQLILVLFLFLYMKGKRFSRPRDEWKQGKRNALEYVEAMARWYDRPDLRNELLKQLSQKLKRELCQTLRISNHHAEQVLLEKVEHYLGREYQNRYKKIVSEPAIWNPKTPSSLFLKSAIEIQRLRKELHEWKNKMRNNQSGW